MHRDSRFELASQDHQRVPEPVVDIDVLQRSLTQIGVGLHRSDDLRQASGTLPDLPEETIDAVGVRVPRRHQTHMIGPGLGCEGVELGHPHAAFHERRRGLPGFLGSVILEPLLDLGLEVAPDERVQKARA